MGVPPVSLLMEEYSDDQFMVAYKLLETLDSFQKLDQERRKESVMLFDRLVRDAFPGQGRIIGKKTRLPRGRRAFYFDKAYRK